MYTKDNLPGLGSNSSKHFPQEQGHWYLRNLGHRSSSPMVRMSTGKAEGATHAVCEQTQFVS